MAVPDGTAVRDALGRVTGSEAFRGSPQLVSFLTYVVEATLAGQGERIKGYTIAVEALGRSEDFDPQVDPIVRVEANRLRRALDGYYGGAGRTDPVRIHVPRGSYMPEFRLADTRETESPQAEPALVPLQPTQIEDGAEPAAPVPRRTSPRWLIAAGLALAIGLSAALALRENGPAPTALPQAPVSPVGAAASGPVARPSAMPTGIGTPTLFVRTFETLSRPATGPTNLAARTLQVRIRDGVSHFDNLRVFAGLLPPVNPGDLSQSDPEDLLTRADYALGATVEHKADGGMALSFRLSDIGTGLNAWSRIFELSAAEARQPDALSGVVRQVVSVLAQPYGVIHMQHIQRVANTASPFACLSTAYAYWQTYTRNDYLAARACLEETVRREPGFAIGFASLAQLYLEEFRTGIGFRPGLEPPLDRALAKARIAVELKPESARAHQAMLDVRFHRGEIDLALAAGRRAVELNPFDTDIVADFGARLVAAGYYREGIAYLEQAVAFNPARPPWQDAFLFLGYHMAGDRVEAQAYATQIDADDYGLGWVMRAVALAEVGHIEQARIAVQRLVALQPAWGRDPRAELSKFFPYRPIADRLMSDLRRAGLNAGG
jgi:hypothetical protein